MRQPRIPLQVWALLWLCLTSSGIFSLAAHGGQPCPSALAPAFWPPSSRLPFTKINPVLLLFLHPGCPCSRASLNQLERLRSQTSRVYDLVTVVGLPGDMNASDASDLLARLGRVSGARVHLDPGLTESRRFGCYTSGQALLYSSSGRLRYQGGLTGSRGHEGDNANSDSLLAVLRGELPTLTDSPVYGCELRKEEFCGGPR